MWPYSQRALIKDKDRPPAIRGIAETMETGLNMEYLPFAGMWRQMLRSELFWAVDHTTAYKLNSVIRHPAQPRAPSWSWAAIDGPIQPGQGGGYEARDREDGSRSATFEILDVQSPSAVPGSAAAHGALVVRGLTKRIAALKAFDAYNPTTNIVDLLGEADPLGDEGSRMFASGNIDVAPLDTSAFPRGTSNFIYLHFGSYRGLILNQVETGSAEVLWKMVGQACILKSPGGLNPQPYQPDIFTKNNQPESLVIV